MPVNTQRLLVPLALAATAFALTACSSSSSAAGGAATGHSTSSKSSTSSKPITVVASTDVWGSIAGAVGGDKVTVTSIITNPAADPHQYEANTRNQLSLSKAQVVIENGGGYDDFIDRMLNSAKNGTADVLNAVTISGRTAPAGGELNEHVWYDFRTTEKVVDRLRSAYTSVDPADASTFRHNADAFTAKLQDLEHREADLRKQDAGRPAAITEPVPLYLLEAIGLKNETPEAFSEAVEEDSDVPAKVLDQALQLYDRHQVDLLVYNAQTTGPETQKVLAAAKQAEIPVVPVTETLPAGQDYLSWMSANLDAITSALEK